MKVRLLSVKGICFSLLALGIITALLLFFHHSKGFSKSNKRNAPPLVHEGGHLFIPVGSPLRQFIVVQPAQEQLVITPFTLPAVVEADPAKMARILPPLIGRVVSLNKHLGENVQSGEILFTLDSSDLAQVMSDTERAKAALTYAEENLARQQRLSRSNITALRDLQQAQNDFEQARSELYRANARLESLNVKKTDVKDHLLIVRSPITGQVVELNAAIGAYWNDLTAAIMTIADLSNVFVTANAQEKDLKHLFVGQDVDIVLDAYSNHFRSKVIFINSLLDSATRTVGVSVFMENKLGLFRPNMFAKAMFLSQPHKRILLPLSATIQRGFDSIVFVEVAPWQFEARLVQLGAQLNDKIEVLSGLNHGERVVVKGGIILND